MSRCAASRRVLERRVATSAWSSAQAPGRAAPAACGDGASSAQRAATTCCPTMCSCSRSQSRSSPGRGARPRHRDGAARARRARARTGVVSARTPQRARPASLLLLAALVLFLRAARHTGWLIAARSARLSAAYVAIAGRRALVRNRPLTAIEGERVVLAVRAVGRGRPCGRRGIAPQPARPSSRGVWLDRDLLRFTVAVGRRGSHEVGPSLLRVATRSGSVNRRDSIEPTRVVRVPRTERVSRAACGCCTTARWLRPPPRRRARRYRWCPRGEPGSRLACPLAERSHVGWLAEHVSATPELDRGR